METAWQTAWAQTLCVDWRHTALSVQIDTLTRQLANAAKDATLRLITPEVREALAALCHDMWSGWMRYQAERAIMAGVMEWGDQIRWTRQMNTPYAALPEVEKESDRKEADRIIELLNQHSR